jgi:alpha-ketoglutarate-dependent taurine dioxygenase
MKITNIYDNWGSHIELSLEEFLAHDKSFWQSLLLDRNLLVFKGIPRELSDESLFDVTTRFGKVWTKDVFTLPYISRGDDKTIKEGTSVSYFKMGNNGFANKYMKYHADMPHVGEYSYPGRLLYMWKNSIDLSGVTTWLNLEQGWDQCTDEEKRSFDGYEVVLHDMYYPETRMEKFPFLKTNPKTGKISPLVNCYYTGTPASRAWIHHVEKDGVALSLKDTRYFIEGVYRLLENKTDILYKHVWDEGDMIVYDNWSSVHSRTAVTHHEEHERILKRTTFNFD